MLDKNQQEVFEGAFYLDKVETSDSTSTHENWKKIFFLKQGYVVFQNNDAQMIDYEIVQFNNQLMLQKQQNILTLVVLFKSKDSVVLRLAQNTYYFKCLEVEKLPLNQYQNHLFIDYVR